MQVFPDRIPRKSILSIQYLRAAAAFAVLFHHALDRAGIRWAVGAAGVDVFFVISGFIMLYSIINRPISASEFLWNRVSRIGPLYWAMTLAITALALTVPAAMPNLQPDMFRLVASILFIPHSNLNGELFPLLVPGWTLNYEMFFYIVVAITLLLPRAAQIPAVFGVLSGLVILGQLLQPVHPIAVVWTNGLLLQFVAGGAIAVAYKNGNIPNARFGLLLLGLGLGAFALLHLTGFYLEQWRFILWGVPATGIVLGALCLEPKTETATLSWVHQLGDASYSIYLTHTLVVAAIARLLGTAELALFLGATTLLAAMVGLVSYRLFEVPTGLWMRGLYHRPGVRGARAG